MQHFFLQLSPQQQKPTINYASKLFLMGSCFVENMGEKLDYHKLRTSTNPLGIIFHPEAIQNILYRIVHQIPFSEKGIFYNNEQWQSFEVHSKFNKIDKNEFLENINKEVKNSFIQLKEASHIVLTFGTAWGYEYKKNGKIVANCHKIPQKEFNKKLATVNELQDAFSTCFNLIQKINPAATLITTVSPIRHIKDGIVENNVSKAHLISALQQSLASNKNTYYYPAYELMMDCLRDYRFYNPDLIHPNQVAIDFIWEHFKQTWLYDAETISTLKQIDEIQKGLTHKPFNPNSEMHLKFKASLKKKIESICNRFPFIKF